MTAEEIRHVALLLQLKAAALLNQLTKAELENVLNGDKGAQALKAATQAGCKLLLGQPRLQASLQRRFQGPEIDFLFYSTTPWLDLLTWSSWWQSRLARLAFFIFNAAVIHPMFMLACALWPPLKAWLEEPGATQARFSFLLHHVPLVKFVTLKLANGALAYRLAGSRLGTQHGSAQSTLLRAEQDLGNAEASIAHMFADDGVASIFWWRWL